MMLTLGNPASKAPKNFINGFLFSLGSAGSLPVCVCAINGVTTKNQNVRAMHLLFMSEPHGQSNASHIGVGRHTCRKFGNQVFLDAPIAPHRQSGTATELTDAHAKVVLLGHRQRRDVAHGRNTCNALFTHLNLALQTGQLGL